MVYIHKLTHNLFIQQFLVEIIKLSSTLFELRVHPYSPANCCLPKRSGTISFLRVNYLIHSVYFLLVMIVYYADFGARHHYNPLKEIETNTKLICMKLLVEWRIAFERHTHIRSLMNIRVVMTLVRIIVKKTSKKVIKQPIQ